MYNVSTWEARSSRSNKEWRKWKDDEAGGQANRGRARGPFTSHPFPLERSFCSVGRSRSVERGERRIKGGSDWWRRPLNGWTRFLASYLLLEQEQESDDRGSGGGRAGNASAPIHHHFPPLPPRDPLTSFPDYDLLLFGLFKLSAAAPPREVEDGFEDAEQRTWRRRRRSGLDFQRRGVGFACSRRRRK